MKIKQNKIYNLTAQEAIGLLLSNKMSDYKTNIEFTKPGNGGNNHHGREPGSKNKLTLKSLDKKIDLSIKSLDAKVNNLSNDIKEVKFTLAKLAEIVQEGFARQEAFNKHVEDVLERHSLTLKHVEDVFKRNNLK